MHATAGEKRQEFEPDSCVAARYYEKSPLIYQDDEMLWGLADRLAARAKAAKEVGDHEMAVEMRAASEAVHAANYLNLALCAMEAAHDEWEKLKRPK